jgi:predicted cupin superfamily sugar epimerase
MTKLSDLLAFIEKRSSQDKVYFALHNDQASFDLFWHREDDLWHFNQRGEEKEVLYIPKGKLLEAIDVYDIDIDGLYGQAYQKVTTKAVWYDIVMKEINEVLGEQAVKDEIAAWRMFADDLVNAIKDITGETQKEPASTKLTLVPDED